MEFGILRVESTAAGAPPTIPESSLEYHKPRIGKERAKDRYAEGTKSLYRKYKHSAGSRELSWNISIEDFRKFLKGACFYCGLKPSNTFKGRSWDITFKYSGLDRVDSGIGYEIENIVSCCSMCNRSKSSDTVDSFLTWARRLVEHSKGYK